MAAALKRFFTGVLPVLLLFALLLTALHLMSDATQNSERFGRLYSWLLLINAAGLLALVTLIGLNLLRLVKQYRAGAAGSRLTVRLVIMFVLLAVAPVSVVYFYSLQFLQRGIDSWFDVQVDTALDDALELSRSALDLRMRDLLNQTQAMAGELAFVPDSLVALNLHDLRSQGGASEVALFTQNGYIIAASSADTTQIIPERPTEAALMQIRQSRTYVALDPLLDTGLHVRVVVWVPAGSAHGESRILQALYPVTERLSTQAASVQAAFARYKELSYLRKPLKDSFSFTLSLVLLLSLLSAVWAAFFSARRLAEPIRVLAEGTRAVASGDYSQRVPLTSHDEMGFLVRSFNDMTRRIAQARDDAARSQQEVEGQRGYLEAVLERLSSGVLTIDAQHTLRTANAAAGHIFGVDLSTRVGHGLDEMLTDFPHLAQFFGAVIPHLNALEVEWREELTLFGAAGRQVLMCRGASLPGGGDTQGGYVIVFDDLTALIQAQRDSAWGEVARRLAHEIKNPLTPIQLSAERLRLKFLNKMAPDEAQVLDRATHTIVQQVEAMKEMVNAFSDYARVPQLRLEPLQLNSLITEVMDLYRGHRWARLRVDLDPGAPPVNADSVRVRQLLHNLIKNSLEAMDNQPGSVLSMSTRYLEEAGYRYVEFTLRDNGPGIPEQVFGQLFEPYVTTKPRGTGLGLAIVKKIVEEHSGMIAAENPADGGARITIRLPLLADAKAHNTPAEHAPASMKKAKGT